MPLLVLLSGCAEEKAVELPPPVVTVTKSIEKKVQDWDEYTGRLSPIGSVEVRPRVSGYITEIKFEDGDSVTKGQPLFIIDPRPYQADFDRAQGAYHQAEAAIRLASVELDRAKQLREKGVLSATDFDQKSATYQQALGALQSAKSALESAKLDLEFSTVTAPIDGRASKANVTVGNLVSEDGKTPLTTIVSTNPIYAYADVDERSLLRYVRFYRDRNTQPEDAETLKVPIQLALQDESDYPHTGYIDFIDNRVDPATGTIVVRGVFDSENLLLSPGLFVRVKIPAGDPYQALLVPQRAVASSQGQKYVVVIGEDNIASIRPVKTGRTIEGMQVITEGLKAGETVVVDGLLKVRPGQKVDPKPLTEKPEEAK
ncbi:MAG TPA: efflux RND transporter periplasmic adaptor subunit [Terrimicrobiaceae bacterium]